MRFSVFAEGIEMRCDLVRLGQDCLIAVQGGSKPHIGATVMAIPRESLTGTGRSATESTLNRTGHKDDFLAGPIAHAMAARENCVVTCVAGVHVDDATPQQLAAIQNAVPEIVERACQLLKEHPDD